MAETKAPGILAGKRGLIMGVANNRSIAWGIAQAARQHGAEFLHEIKGERGSARAIAMEKSHRGIQAYRLKGRATVMRKQAVKKRNERIYRIGRRPANSARKSETLTLKQ